MKKNIILSYIYVFLTSFYIDLALWTIYLSEKKGLSLLSLGILQAVYVSIRLIFEIPSGIVSDKIGRVKTLILSSLCLVFSNIFILFGTSMTVICISYALFGISVAFMSGTFESFVYDTLKANKNEDSYKNINTTIYLISMLSIAGAMGIGGYLASINMDYMYVGNIIIAVLSVLTCLFMNEPVRENLEYLSVKVLIKDSINLMKTNRQLLNMVIFITSIASISNLSWHFSQKLFQEYGMNNTEITSEAIITTLICGLAAKVSYGFEKKLGIQGISIISGAMLSVPLFLVGFASNVYMIVILLIFISSSISFADPNYSFYINQQVKSENRSTFLSIKNFGNSIFTLLFVGALGAFNNIQLSFMIIGLALLISYMLIVFVFRKYFTKEP